MELTINTYRRAPELVADSAWFKSSYSNDSGGSCVEIADLTSSVAVRDSKDKKGPALVVSLAAWSSFVDLVQSGALDHGLMDN
jgi:hypothetical protein